jgi:hypothetical protein
MSNPIGSPDCEKPHGTEIDGKPPRLKANVVNIAGFNRT